MKLFIYQLHLTYRENDFEHLVLRSYSVFRLNFEFAFVFENYIVVGKSIAAKDKGNRK